MPLRNNFERQISLMRGLKELLSAYEELSVMRIGQVRGQVLATRTFREGLFQVFSAVRSSRRAEIEELLRQPRHRNFGGLLRSRFPSKKKGQEEVHLRSSASNLRSSAKRLEPQREAAVLLSGNQKLSGNITQTIFRRFLEHIDKAQPAAVVVVGTVGRESLTAARPTSAFKYFDLPGEHAPLREHRDLVRFLRDFDEVSIFYGKFVNVVDQIAATTKLSSIGRLNPLTAASSPEPPRKRPRDYLFEPQLPAVLAYFDTQVFALLFQQTLSESSLATLGSRITAMEMATANVERSLGKLMAAQLQDRKTARSRKQRQMLAGLSLWGV